MSSISSFGQAVHEILLNNYLEAILKTQKLDILSPLTGSHNGETVLKKAPLFKTLNPNISIPSLC